MVLGLRHQQQGGVRGVGDWHCRLREVWRWVDCRYQRHGTILFKCLNGEHRALTDVHYIPRLRSSIVSIGQLDERGCQVLINNSILRIHDHEYRLLTKVNLSRNWIYVLDLHPMQPVCLAARQDVEPCLWHALGHLNFDTLGSLAHQEMVHGLPLIKHAGKLSAGEEAEEAAVLEDSEVPRQ